MDSWFSHKAGGGGVPPGGPGAHASPLEVFRLTTVHTSGKLIQWSDDQRWQVSSDLALWFTDQGWMEGCHWRFHPVFTNGVTGEAATFYFDDPRRASLFKLAWG